MGNSCENPPIKGGVLRVSSAMPATGHPPAPPSKGEYFSFLVVPPRGMDDSCGVLRFRTTHPCTPEGVKEFVSPCRSSLLSDSSPLVRGGTCSRCSLNSFTPSLPWSGIVFISPALHPNGTDRGPGPLIFRRASKLNVGGALRRGDLSTLFHIRLGRQNSRLKPVVGQAIPALPVSKRTLLVLPSIPTYTIFLFIQTDSQH